MNSFNRAQRRANLRKNRSRLARGRSAIAGASLVAATGLLGSFSYLRPIAAYASGPCALDVSNATSASDLQNAVDAALQAQCAGLTLQASTDTTIELATAVSINPQVSDVEFSLTGSGNGSITFAPYQYMLDDEFFYVGIERMTFSNLSFDGEDYDYTRAINSGFQGFATELTLNGTTFTDFNFSGDGGAIYLAEGSLDISGSTFTGNRIRSYDEGGAIAVQNVLQNGVVDGNPALVGGFITIDDTLFSENYANYGGALYLRNADDSVITITDSTFTLNSADDEGGAIAISNTTSDAEILISDSTFSGNFTDYGDYGGAIWIYDIYDTDITIASSTFTENSSRKGGAIYLDNAYGDSTITITDSSFTDNYGTDDGGAIYFDLLEDYATVRIEDSTFVSNESLGHGGALYFDRQFDNSSVIISSTVFLENRSDQNGGAVSFDNFRDTSTFEILDSTFESNYAAYDGGAIYVEARYTDGVPGSVGTISGTLFLSNEAGENGGAIYFGDSSYSYYGDATSPFFAFNVFDSTFAYNSASEAGAIDSSHLTLMRNSTLFNNEGGVVQSLTIDSWDNGSAPIIESSTIWNTLTGDAFEVTAPGSIAIVNSVVAHSSGYASLFLSSTPSTFIANSFLTGIDAAGEVGIDSWGGQENIQGSDPGLAIELASSTNGTSHIPVLIPLGASVLQDAGNPEFSGFGEGVPVLDQRGLDRVFNSRIDIGAVELQSFEWQAREGQVPAFPAINPGPTPKVVSLSPTSGRSGSTITITGERLDLVEGLAVGNQSVQFTRLPNGSLSFVLPTGLASGVYDLNLRVNFGQLVVSRAFTISTTAPKSTTLRYTNFVGDRSVLTTAARSGIRAELGKYSNITKVVCTGSTSGTRVTTADRRLALARAKAACDLIKQIRPEVVVELQSRPASGVGARFRSVTIQITGN